MRIPSAVVLGLLVATARGEAENEATPEALPESVVLVGELESGSGGKLEGRVVFAENGIGIISEGAPMVVTPLDDIVRLLVRRKAASNEKQPGAPTGQAPPAPWRNRDLGRTIVPGKVAWGDGKFLISSSPRAEDERFAAFHLVYFPVKGDCEIQARVVSLANEDEDSYAGIVICDGTTPENRKAVLGIHPHGDKGVSFRRWGYQGGNSTGKKIPSLQLPYWVKLVRKGYDVRAYYSPDGRRWKFLEVSPGRMRDEQVYVGLAVRMQKYDRLSEAVIDRVSINGEGDRESEPILPHVVLRAGSRLAAEVRRGDRTALHLGGRLEGLAVTMPQVARVEFFHPLPEEVAPLVDGKRVGLLLRSGDFSEGTLDYLREGKLRLGSVLFGSREHSVLEECDCLVLREVVEEPARYRVETLDGSVLLAQQAGFRSGRLVLEVAGLGEIEVAPGELKSLAGRK